MGTERNPEWDKQMADAPIKSCGRLDASTYLLTDETLGRVTSDRVRYVYFEDGSEVICLGKFADFVAYQAATWAALESENAALRDQLDELHGALALYRSMVLSGENESDHSRSTYEAAMGRKGAPDA